MSSLANRQQKNFLKKQKTWVESEKNIIFASEKETEGDLIQVSFVVKSSLMITKSEITKIAEEFLVDTDYFLVDVCVSSDNRIVVEIDSFKGVDIDFCANLSKKIEENFDREQEDFELEVGSSGLTSPFKVSQQYEKNLGNEVEVLTKNGEKLTGILTKTNEDSFVLTVEMKEKLEGAKRKTLVQKDLFFEKNNIKYIKYLIRFK